MSFMLKYQSGIVLIAKFWLLVGATFLLWFFVTSELKLSTFFRLPKVQLFHFSCLVALAYLVWFNWRLQLLNLSSLIANFRLIRSITQNQRTLIIVLIGFALFNLAYLMHYWSTSPWLFNDSYDYLSLYPFRTIGYTGIIRGLAEIYESPRVIVVFQLLLTLVVSFHLSLAVGLILENKLSAVLFGYVLFSSWPWFFHSYQIGTDQIFFALLAWHFAFALDALRSLNKKALFMMALTTAVLISIRPAGIFLLGTLPFFWVLFSWERRRVALFYIVPLLMLLSAVVLFNRNYLGFHGFSSFAGASFSGSTLLLLNEDTKVSDAELKAEILPIARKYQTEFQNTDGLINRYKFLRYYASPLSNDIINKTAVYLQSHEHEPWSSPLSKFFSGKSNLNKIYDRIGEIAVPKAVWFSAFNNWEEVNRVLSKLAWEVHLGNWRSWLSFSILKMYGAWQEVVPFFSMSRNLGSEKFIDPSAEKNNYISSRNSQWGKSESSKLKREVYDWFAAIPYALAFIFQLPLLLAIIVVYILIKGGISLVRFNPVSPRKASIIYASLCLVLYHIELSIANVPLTRFLIAGTPFALFLIIATLLRLYSRMKQIS